MPLRAHPKDRDSGNSVKRVDNAHIHGSTVNSRTNQKNYTKPLISLPSRASSLSSPSALPALELQDSQMQRTARTTASDAKSHEACFSVLRSLSCALAPVGTCPPMDRPCIICASTESESCQEYHGSFKKCLGELSLLTWIPSSAIHLTGSSTPANAS